ncbi:hypothetical protein [Microbacterium sp. AR7-10]|uniref:hypothetical protein n=1 Tax=Microbacterium sp. AR7-10 TaxID=1891970 RepID=UPI0008FCAE46|nr:hypothetical protein [Microbacterium sp. AR7-10]OIU84611.1 hypothetical protein BFN01_02150 [Microbacterium sp. AR7-10]
MSGVVVNKGLRIEGLRELNAKLRKVGDDSQDMPDLMHRIGNIVIANAQPPRESGELAGTMRAGRGKTKAVVRVGYARRGGHAGVVHYGDPHRGHRANRFMIRALDKARPAVIRELEHGIDSIIRKNRLA